jgi:hypothetical protein
MAVRELSGSFTGLRVQRSIGGEPHIKNYSYRVPVKKSGTTTWRDATVAERKRLLAQAQAYDARLERSQLEQKLVKSFEPFGARTNTGIRGITYGFQKDGEGYSVEAFWLRVRHDGRQRTAVARLSRRSWAEGWNMIVERLTEIKNLDAVTLTQVLAAIPNETTLRQTLVAR